MGIFGICAALLAVYVSGIGILCLFLVLCFSFVKQKIERIGY